MKKITKRQLGGEIYCYFDGACEPTSSNGNIGIGALITTVGNKKLLEYSHGYIYGKDGMNLTSNNMAEYMAIIKIAEYLIENKLTNKKITIQGDSQLVVNQMKGEWGINAGVYLPYAYKAKSLLSKMPKAKIEWIPRELNYLADGLSKKWLNENNIKITTREKAKTSKSEAPSYNEFKRKLVSMGIRPKEETTNTPTSSEVLAFPFGKYKGEIINDCTDKGYLKWLIKELRFKNNRHLLRALEARLELLEKQNH